MYRSESFISLNADFADNDSAHIAIIRLGKDWNLSRSFEAKKKIFDLDEVY